MEMLEKIFQSNFMPHGHCYFWRPEIVWTNAISDGIIALAYLTIPFTLVYIIRARKDMNFIYLVLLFALFILGCGATHVMDVINIWNPLYYLDSFLRVITALASIGTAIMLVRITPRILLIPNPEQFKKLNEELKEQLQQVEEKEKQLREREALLLETQEIAKIGSFEYDLELLQYKSTPQMKKIFGFTEEEVITEEEVFKRIHPEDRNKVKDSIEKAIKNIEAYNVEYRVVRPDQSEKHVQSMSKVHFDVEGKPVRWVGTVMDLTEEVEAEEMLHAMQTELSEIKEFVFLAESLPQIVWTAKPDGEIEYINQNWYNYTGLPIGTSKDKHWSITLHPNDYQATIDLWNRALTEGQLYQAEFRIKKFDGTYRWFLVKAVPMKDDDGNLVKWFGTILIFMILRHTKKPFLKIISSLQRQIKIWITLYTRPRMILKRQWLTLKD